MGDFLNRCAFAESCDELEAGPFHLPLIKGRKAVWLRLQQRPTLPHTAGGRGFCSLCIGLDVLNVLNLRFLYPHVDSYFRKLIGLWSCRIATALEPFLSPVLLFMADLVGIVLLEIAEQLFLPKTSCCLRLNTLTQFRSSRSGTEEINSLLGGRSVRQL